MPTTIQRLYETCKDVFSDVETWAVPAAEDVDRLKTVLVQPLGSGLAKVKTDAFFAAPCETSILYPAAGGIMHCLTTITSCAGARCARSTHLTLTLMQGIAFIYNDFSNGDASLVSRENGRYACLEERETRQLLCAGG